jgi:hypothetical protein
MRWRRAGGLLSAAVSCFVRRCATQARAFATLRSLATFFSGEAGLAPCKRRRSASAAVAQRVRQVGATEATAAFEASACSGALPRTRRARACVTAPARPASDAAAPGGALERSGVGAAGSGTPSRPALLAAAARTALAVSASRAAARVWATIAVQRGAEARERARCVAAGTLLLGRSSRCRSSDRTADAPCLTCACGSANAPWAP